MAYGGMGMGYGYSNGLLTGLLIGNMLHPHNTVVYSGPGGYSNNALMYPDGRVVSSSGQLLGNYQGGAFVGIQNGPMVAQQIQADRPIPIVVKDNSGELIAAALVAGFLLVVIVLIVVL